MFETLKDFLARVDAMTPEDELRECDERLAQLARLVASEPDELTERVCWLLSQRGEWLQRRAALLAARSP